MGYRPDAEVKLESEFIRDLDLDSLDLVELILFLEEEFEITLPDEEMEQVVTVSDAVKLIQSNLG